MAVSDTIPELLRISNTVPSPQAYPAPAWSWISMHVARYPAPETHLVAILDPQKSSINWKSSVSVFPGDDYVFYMLPHMAAIQDHFANQYVETTRYHTPDPALSNPELPELPKPFQSVSSVRRTKACKRQTSQADTWFLNKRGWSFIRFGAPLEALFCSFGPPNGSHCSLPRFLPLVAAVSARLEQDNGCSWQGASLKSESHHLYFPPKI